MVQVSLDGPNVNKAYLTNLKKKLKDEGNPGDPKLLSFGSCGLHTVHVAFKTGCNDAGWMVVKF